MKIFRPFSTLLILAAVLLQQASFTRASRLLYTANPTRLEQAQPTPQPFTGASDPIQNSYVVRAYFTNPEMVRLVTSRWEPWEVNYQAGYLVLEVDASGIEYLRASGFAVEIDQKLTYLVNRPAVFLPDQTEGIPSYPCYRTVEETYAAGEGIAITYPNLATWLDIGDTWEKITPGGSAGYDLMVLRLTNSLVPGPKPKLFVMSSLHAREYAPAELSTRFAEHLVSRYGADPDITYLLDYFEIHLLLMANPDGRKKAETGLAWRKNTNNNFCSNTNSRGVDLNRNFDFAWGCCGGSSSYACDETFRGPSIASEPEVQAVQAYVSSIYPDWRLNDDLTTPADTNASGIFLDVHSYGKLVLWPWGFTSSQAPNSSALQTLGRKLAYFNGYTPEQSIYLYPTDGTTDDFAYGRLGLPAYTIELGTAFFQDCNSFRNVIVPDNIQALLYAAKVSQAPYQSPSGPDAFDLQMLPSSAAPGESILVQATVDDQLVSGGEPTQIISAAEYSIDQPPWSSAAITYPLQATDGLFDEKTESVQATLDTSTIAHGKHTLYLRGRDASGNWGPVSAFFFAVIDPAIAPRLYGYVRDASNNIPLDALVSAGNFSIHSQPLSGYYEIYLLEGEYTLTASAPDHATLTVNNAFLKNGQSMRQDFYLLPTCPLFSDDIESGNPGWDAGGSWAISTEAFHSPTHAWSDSPGGTYGNNRNISLTSPVIDLTGAINTQLSFWHIYDLEAGYDYGYVEYSTDGGGNWTVAATYNGVNQTTWNQVTLALPALDGVATAQIRFHLVTDSTVVEDGWHVDDVQISAGQMNCAPPTAPKAQFMADPTAVTGQVLQFINLSTGTNPLSYQWDFGDSSSSVASFEPQHSYVLPGIFTVTLSVSNTLGNSIYYQPVLVEPFLPTEFIYLGEIYLSAPAD